MPEKNLNLEDHNKKTNTEKINNRKDQFVLFLK